jgi:hypothetical protein
MATAAAGWAAGSVAAMATAAGWAAATAALTG